MVVGIDGFGVLRTAGRVKRPVSLTLRSRMLRLLSASAHARVGTAIAIIGEAHFLAHRFDEAAPYLLLAIQEDPSLSVPYLHLAACYAHVGRSPRRERSSRGCVR